MKSRFFLLLVAVFAGIGWGFAQDAVPSVSPKGAVAAMLAVPIKFSNSILQVSGNHGDPNPSEWHIIARDTDTQGTIVSLRVAGGQVVAEAPSVNLGQMFREAGYLTAAGLTVDSGDAFLKALSYAVANGRTLGSVNYTLIRRGADVEPVWKLQCFDANGKHIGDMQVEATSGAVVWQHGFPKAP